MMNKKLKKSALKSARSLYRNLPVLAGIVLLISLANTLVPKIFYSQLFSGNIFQDSFIGSVIGSILAGNPITSYILGGEFLVQGVSLVAITAFMVSWVTVGLVQLPAESIMLGRRFAIFRNAISFILSIIVAIITVLVVGIL